MYDHPIPSYPIPSPLRIPPIKPQWTPLSAINLWHRQRKSAFIDKHAEQNCSKWQLNETETETANVGTTWH